MTSPGITTMLRYPQFLIGKTIASTVFLYLFILQISVAQYVFEPTEYDHITISVQLSPLKASEIPAIIQHQVLYLSLKDVLEYLEMPCEFTPDLSIISGSFLNPQDHYKIYVHQYKVLYQNNTHIIHPEDMILLEEKLFLQSGFFGEIFGLECTYNQRSLSAIFTSTSELPVIRAYRLEQNRHKFHRPNNDFVPDTSIGQKFTLFHLGAADWSIQSSHQLHSRGYTRFGLSLGGELAGGELKGVFTHRTDIPFDERQQYYNWRYVNNNHSAIRQVMAGKISPQSIASIYRPVIGLQITNAPTTPRRSFGAYTYTDQTLPDCLIEVYINNTLVDYIRSDGTGFFSYQIPLSYGSTSLRFQVFGPHGEVFQMSKNFTIPFTFLPSNELEYTLSSGMVEDGSGSFYAQGKVNYGLTDFITLGGGQEYLLSNKNELSLSFFMASINIGEGLYVTGDYVNGVRYRGGVTYRSPKNIQFEMLYSKYEENQEAVRFTYKEAYKASLFIPIKINTSTINSKFTAAQNSSANIRYYNLDWQLSLSSRNFGAYLTHSMILHQNNEPHLYGTLTSSIRLPGKISIRPRILFNYTNNQFMTLSATFEKSFHRGFNLNASYEKVLSQASHHYRVGFRYELPFARVSSNVNIRKEETSFFQTASGSIIFDNKADHISFTKNSNVGRGGVAFIPFLDLNGNGKMEKNERKVYGLNVKSHQGGGKKTLTDSTFVISGLEAHRYAQFTIDGNRFDNVSWKLKHTALSILIEPNQLKRIEIPVVPVGEAAGMVFLRKDSSDAGIGRILVQFFDADSLLVATTLTESDGYFSYLGLSPGSYTATVDAAQLGRLQLTCFPDSIQVTIQPNIDGDIVDILEFILEKDPRD